MTRATVIELGEGESLRMSPVTQSSRTQGFALPTMANCILRARGGNQRGPYLVQTETKAMVGTR